MVNYLKRFSLELNGLILATFPTLGEALEWMESHNLGAGLLTLYDHEDKEIIINQISI